MELVVVAVSQPDDDDGTAAVVAVADTAAVVAVVVISCIIFDICLHFTSLTIHSFPQRYSSFHIGIQWHHYL